MQSSSVGASCSRARHAREATFVFQDEIQEVAAIRTAEVMRATDIWTSHVDAQTVIEIGQPRRGPCVSMFRSITGGKGAVDAREMAELLAKAARLLDASGTAKRDAAEILRPAKSLVEAHQVWESGARGIAVFTSPDLFAVVMTGMPLSTGVVVARRFVTRPLLPALENLTDFELRWALAELSARLNGHVEADIGKALAAASAGSVVDLYIDRDAHAWGCFDPSTSSVERILAMAPGADDLIDLAAVTTIARGGRVHVVDCLEYGGTGVPVLAQVLRPKQPTARGRRASGVAAT